MEKKVILRVLVLCFFSALIGSALAPVVSADTINNYEVKDPVPLNQYATAYGLFQDTDANVHGNVLCSFYLLDINGVLIDRADDQYTDSLGYFMSKFAVTEPDFKRGETYTYRTVCGGISVDGNVTIGQRESLSHVGGQEFDYLTSPENTDTIFIWGIFGLILLVGVFVGWNILKVARGK